MKRSSLTTVAEPAYKTAKIGGKQVSLQNITNSGTPLTTFDGKLYSIQQNTNHINSSNAAAFSNKKHQFIRTADVNNILASGNTNTSFKFTTSPDYKQFSLPFIQSNGVLNSSSSTGVAVRRPTIYIKREAPKKTIRNVTTELIEKNPQIHLGVTTDRLGILKNVLCPAANVSLMDLYLTLKKLRQNEDFSLLAEYFELNETEVQQTFTRTIVKLARYMKFLIRWPESKKYYDRHKNLPIAFRSKLSYVQSLIECVETEIQPPTMYPSVEQLDCSNYKFILTITPTGVISYISDAYVGHNDDLTIFNACNFQNVIPKYLSLVADPGKAIRRRSKKVKNVGRMTTDISTKDKQKSRDTKTNALTIKSTESDSTTDSADESDYEDSDGVLNGTACGGSSGGGGSYPRKSPNSSCISHQTLKVVNSELISCKVKDFKIPTVRVRESVCRLQIRHMLFCLREFKVLQPFAIIEPLLYQYINEVLIVASALTNLQR